MAFVDELVDRLHMGLYGKVASPRAAENQGPEFQAGYAFAQSNRHIAAESLIADEWARRSCPDPDDPAFLEWKRGLLAARLQQALTSAST